MRKLRPENDKFISKKSIPVLLCLPHAGGSAYSFSPFKKQHNRGFRLEAVELKGRGKRIIEPLSPSFEDMAFDILTHYGALMDSQPFAIFGHSMGGFLAYEIYRCRKKNGQTLPLHLFFSGMPCPLEPEENPRLMHKMDDEEFMENIQVYGGIQKELTMMPEWKKYFFPVLRSDIKNLETRNCKLMDEIISTSISVFYGKEEKISPNSMLAWKLATSGNCYMEHYPGGHFFLENHFAQISESIAYRINQSQKLS